MTTPNRRSNAKSIDTANEEWSEILAVTTEASITTPLQLRLAPGDPTPLEIDVNTALSAQDLQCLKKQDPFLYYSIPGVRNASVRLDAVDMHQLAQDGLRRKCASCPASIQIADASTTDAVAKVKRCTRVSFECHVDLLLEDLFDDHVDMDMGDISLGRMDGVLAELFR